VRHVVEDEARDCDRAQIVRGGGRRQVPHAVSVRVERQRDERLEAAGLVLQRADAQQVVHAVLEGFHVSEQHRGVRAQAHAVRYPVHLQPLLAGRLVRRNPAPNLRVEDLGPAAGQAVEPRRTKALEHLRHGHAVVNREEVDLHGGEALEVNVRLDALEAPEKLLVVGKREARVQTVHDVDLGRRVIHPLLELRPGLLEAHRVRAGHVLLKLRKGAEEARRDAHVRHFDAHVAIEIRAVAVEPLTNAVGELAELEEIAVAEQAQRIVHVESHALANLLADTVEVTHATPPPARERRPTPRSAPRRGASPRAAAV